MWGDPVMAERPVNADRFVAIHSHFYQPPRENPWLEAVEIQDSAAPYHDWNERVTAECYAPNTAARRVAQPGQMSASLKPSPSRSAARTGASLASRNSSS